MYTLIVSEEKNSCALFKNGNLAGFENEINYSCYNQYPVFSVKKLIDRFNLNFSDIDYFIYVGPNSQRYNALLNLELLEMYDHLNRKEIITINSNISKLYYSLKKSDFNNGVCLIWDFEGIKTYKINSSNIKETIFDVDEKKYIKKFSELITNYAGSNFLNLFLCHSFLRDMSLYNQIKDKFFDFKLDGTMSIKIEELKNYLFDKQKKPEILFTLKKLMDDILIHFCNYLKYLTKEENIILQGDFVKICLANGRISKYIPFNNVYVNLLPEYCYIQKGAFYKFQLELNNTNSFGNEQKEIEKIIYNLFEDFHSENIDKIRKYFLYMDDEVFLKIRDFLSKCTGIRFNFVLKDIVISSSGRKAWAIFYFYFFGKFKESRQNVILNYKTMMFLKKDEKSWDISDIEFYNFENLPVLTMELSNSCNFNCIMCDNDEQNKNSFMSFKTFKNIIDSLDHFKVSTITPFWLGEPLMNPEFKKMLSYAFDKNKDNRIFTSFTINTNAYFLDNENTNAILENTSRKSMAENTFIRIHFSLDAFSKKTFNKIHKSDSYEKVKNNILNFIQKRNEAGINYPKITVAIIVMEENYQEVASFVEFWKNIFRDNNLDYFVTYDWPCLEKDAIYIRRLDCENQNEAEKMHYNKVKELGLISETKECQDKEETADDEVHERIINTDSVLIRENLDYYIRRPCPALWKTPIIKWNGDVTVCCFDIDMQLKTGNINNKNLSQLWNSELIKKWRLFHIRGDFYKIKRCAKCHNINSPVMKNAEFIEYLVKINKKDEIEKAHFIN
ncbi:MAG: radical SAM protein [Candidatus Muiribacteriota bacterium]